MLFKISNHKIRHKSFTILYLIKSYKLNKTKLYNQNQVHSMSQTIPFAEIMTDDVILLKLISSKNMNMILSAIVRILLALANLSLLSGVTIGRECL